MVSVLDFALALWFICLLKRPKRLLAVNWHQLRHGFGVANMPLSHSVPDLLCRLRSIDLVCSVHWNNCPLPYIVPYNLYDVQGEEDIVADIGHSIELSVASFSVPFGVIRCHFSSHWIISHFILYRSLQLTNFCFSLRQIAFVTCLASN